MKGRVSSGGYSNLRTRSKDFISDLPILFPKSRCSLKKKGLHLESISVFPIFCPDFSKFRSEHLDFGNKIGKSEINEVKTLAIHDFWTEN